MPVCAKLRPAWSRLNDVGRLTASQATANFRPAPGQQFQDFVAHMSALKLTHGSPLLLQCSGACCSNLHNIEGADTGLAVILCRAVGFRQAGPSACLQLQTRKKEKLCQLVLAACCIQYGYYIPADNHDTSSLQVTLALPASASACGRSVLAPGTCSCVPAYDLPPIPPVTTCRLGTILSSWRWSPLKSARRGWQRKLSCTGRMSSRLRWRPASS